MTIPHARLWLVGDDDDALEALADLSRHLDYFSVARLDGAPTEALGARDHVVVACDDPARASTLLAETLAHGTPGWFGTIPARDRAGAGARAILVAAQLADALYR
jgi:hypothetical protein